MLEAFPVQGVRAPSLAMFKSVLMLCRAVLLVALTQAATPAVAQDDHVIQSQDVLRIRVGQFDPVSQAYVNWDSVSGEYRVSPTGQVTVPMIGAVTAAGTNPAELSQDLTDMLNRRLGLDESVDVIVDLASFRNIFVIGAVNAPGAYPYTPGLSVLQALSLAGGTERMAGTLLQSQRSAISTQGQYRLLQMNLLANLATEARLTAELNEEDIETPPRLEEAPLGEELMQREREIKEARDTAFRSSLDQIEGLETLLQEQIARQNEQLELRERQLTLVREELSTASDLVERGLSTASRASSLERLVADQEVRMLELETSTLQAQQRLNEARRDRLNLTNDRRRNLVSQLRGTRVTIEETRLKLDTQAALFAEAMRMGDGYVMPDSKGQPTIQITRRGPEGPEVFTATRATTVRPDDVIEVSLPDVDSVRVFPLDTPNDAAEPPGPLTLNQ